MFHSYSAVVKTSLTPSLTGSKGVGFQLCTMCWLCCDHCILWLSWKKMLHSSDMVTCLLRMLLLWGRKWWSFAVNYAATHWHWSVPLVFPMPSWAQLHLIGLMRTHGPQFNNDWVPWECINEYLSSLCCLVLPLHVSGCMSLLYFQFLF